MVAAEMIPIPLIEELLSHLREESLNGSFDSFDLDFQELHLDNELQREACQEHAPRHRITPREPDEEFYVGRVDYVAAKG